MVVKSSFLSVRQKQVFDFIHSRTDAKVFYHSCGSVYDLIPDFIPVAGFLDDIAVAAFVLNTLLNNIDPEIVRRHWAGEDDILVIVRRVIDSADKMIGKGMYQRIERLIKTKLQ